MNASANDPNGALVAQNIFRQTFLGVPVVQRWDDLWLWEQVFQQTPQIRGVVELGTLKGGLSLFLWLQTVQRKQKFCTLDHVEGVRPTPLSTLMVTGSVRLLVDMWSETGRAEIAAILDDDAWHPLLLLCDGGNKPREVQTFTPLLRAGDIVAVHDWNTEFGEGDLDPVRHLLDPHMRELNESVPGSMTRWWVKR